MAHSLSIFYPFFLLGPEKGALKMDWCINYASMCFTYAHDLAATKDCLHLYFYSSFILLREEREAQKVFFPWESQKTLLVVHIKQTKKRPKRTSILQTWNGLYVGSVNLALKIQYISRISQKKYLLQGRPTQYIDNFRVYLVFFKHPEVQGISTLFDGCIHCNTGHLVNH